MPNLWWLLVIFMRIKKSCRTDLFQGEMGKEAVERLKKHGFIVIEEKEGVCRYVVIQMAFFQGRRF